jgi:hypothetical protein
LNNTENNLGNKEKLQEKSAIKKNNFPLKKEGKMLKNEEKKEK